MASLMRMSSIDLPYLFRPRGYSRVYTYYRRNGIRTRLPEPDTADFLDAYRAVHAIAEAATLGRVSPVATDPPGSLGALVTAYKQSEEWRGLAESTRGDYAKSLEPLRRDYGSLPVATMPRRFVLDLRDKYARKSVPARSPDGKPVLNGRMVEIATPRRANGMINVLRLLLTWAVDRGWRRDNPALRSGRIAIRSPGRLRWSDEAIAAFMGCAEVGEPPKRALALGLYTGARKADCLSMTHTARRDGTITLVPAKTQNSTGVRLEIPEHPELRRILNAAPAASAVTILTREDGKPWKEDHFNHAFAKAVKAAGLSGLSFHGLRKTASARLAEAGATDAQIDAVLGHSDPRMTRLYRAQADQRAGAKAAITKLTRRESRK